MRRDIAWQWGPPALALLLLAIVYLSGANQSLFLLLNHASFYTGDALWAWLTVMGDTTVVLALLLLLRRRHPELVWAALLAALLATAWTHGLKPLLDMPRPPAVLDLANFHIIGPAHRTGSFPSGHSTAIFTLAGVLVLGLGARWLRWGVLGFAILVALSRSVVGVHWPLDLLGGMLGGWLSALGGMWLANRWPWERKRVVRWLSVLIPALAAGMLLLGHDTGYVDAALLQRVIGLVCLALLGQDYLLARRAAMQGNL